MTKISASARGKEPTSSDVSAKATIDRPKASPPPTISGPFHGKLPAEPSHIVTASAPTPPTLISTPWASAPTPQHVEP